jgi:siroheme synthase
MISISTGNRKRKGTDAMNAEQIQERIETLTVRMDNAARKSSADPVIQGRLHGEVEELWAEIQQLEVELRTIKVPA